MGDDQTQRTANGPEKSAGDHAGPDSLISRGRLITVTGHGSSTDPAQLGGRLADLALSAVDPSEFVPR